MTSPAAAKKQNQTAYDKTISTITLMQKSLSDAHAKLAALTSTDLWRPKIFELLGISKTHLETLETQSGPPVRTALAQ